MSPPSAPASPEAPDPDRPSQDLSYDDLRRLARNPALSENQRMGFGPAHRPGNEDAIFADILSKLPALRETGRTIVDIGPGCGPLALLLIAHCAAHRHRLVLVDSPEMLATLPDQPGCIKVAGRYPGNAASVTAAAEGGADAILCYSVLHIIYVDDNPFHALDQVIELLAPGGGYALFGDIPNVSKRKRFLASAAGAAFHRRYMQTDAAPEVAFNRLERGRIDDAVLAALVQRAQGAGCDAYVMPQPDELPYANRRDDLVIRKP